PKAVYIIENGGYTELTYEEFRRREQICPLYADKLFLPLYGRLMEVSKEDYMEFYRAKRRQKYLDERSADNGDFSYDKVIFQYKNFLGYRKGEDGQPEIVPEEAETICLIYDRFLAGDSLKGIAELLEEKGIKSPTGKAQWQFSTIQSILSNEKYKGDAIINKTYITDCISKKVRVNNGERPKYYVENSHPAIIDSATFGRVQEELARRSGKRKVRQKAKTEQGKYSSKYAMTELLVCGECKTPYRRCTWTAGGKKKIVWRCINRLDYGKKYCHNSPTIEESILQKVVMTAIMETANQNTEVLRTLKLHIGMGLEGEKSNDNSLDLQVRIAEIDAEFRKMIDRVSTETVEAFDEETATRLMNEKSRLQQKLDNIADAEQRRENAKSRLDDIYTILDSIKNRPMEYDDQIVRQLLECIVVDSKEQVTVIFKGGLKSVQPLTE
ncbi:MAG: recombinase family protein, partial [Clostridiales bacterium]|nr:recombinase family protein [Clostridiales bacterium]